MMTTETAPIACTLSAGDFKDRIGWIAQLNRDALRKHERRDLALDLTYEPEAAARVREMVRREQECCAFLAFDLREGPNETRLIITAPVEAREAADALFEQFLGSARPAAGCGCTTAKRANSALPRSGTGKAAGGVALVSATCAVAACSVCVLPFAVPALFLAGTGGVLAWLGNAHIWMTVLAMIAVAGAWVLIWRQSARSGLRPAPSTLAMMGLASAFAASALFWPQIEPRIFYLIGG